MKDAPKIHPYLTIIEGRRPRQKTHTSLGQAQKAILFRLGGRSDTITENCKVYKWTDHGWERLWDIPAGTGRGELPWK